jgi:hypothetical protein
MNQGLTVITCLLAGDENIFETADSLMDQASGEVRWIIKYSVNKIPDSVLDLESRGGFVKVLGIDDKSFYSGLNQALNYLETSFFVVVGSGDKFEPGMIGKLGKLLKKETQFDALFLAAKNSRDGAIFRPRPNEIAMRMSCPHPGSVLRTDFVRALGGFDEKYLIASDYDLLSRYLKEHTRVAFSDEILLEYRAGGFSDRNRIDALLEEELIRRRIWKCAASDVVSKINNYAQWCTQKVS